MSFTVGLLLIALPILALNFVILLVAWRASRPRPIAPVRVRVESSRHRRRHRPVPHRDRGPQA